MVPGTLYEKYAELDAYHQYTLILQAFWGETDWEELFADLAMDCDSFSLEKQTEGLGELSALQSGQAVLVPEDTIFSVKPADWLLLDRGNVLHSLAVLGFWEIEILPS